MGLLLQEQQVFTHSTFISIPTVPLEQRPAHERGNRSHSSNVDIIRENSLASIAIGQGNRNFLCQQIREHLSLPECRQFTNIKNNNSRCTFFTSVVECNYYVLLSPPPRNFVSSIAL